MKKTFQQMTYYELTQYVNELSTELWLLKKGFEQFPELSDCMLYATAIKRFIDMIDCINAYVTSLK